MKKRYEKPEVQVMKIKTTALMAGSATPDVFIGDGTVGAGDVESRRGRRDWDDEDEDEDWDY